MENKFQPVEIFAKLIALQNERVRRWNDLESRTTTTNTLVNVLYYKDKFICALRYIVGCGLTRGYYTEEEQQGIEICKNEINLCDKALNDCVRKAFEDKITYTISAILSKK